MFYAFNFRKLKKALKKLFIFVIAAAVLLAVGYMAAVRLFPVKYEAIIKKYAAEYGIDELLVYAVIHAESKFDPYAQSNKGASGLMQLTQKTADWGASEIGIEDYNYNNIYEPDLNIRLGCWFLRYLLDMFVETDVAIAAYNAGNGNVSKWLADEKYSSDGKTLTNIPFEETQNYVGRVKRNILVYTVLKKLNFSRFGLNW